LGYAQIGRHVGPHDSRVGCLAAEGRLREAKGKI
jgi:hypothetical protein